MADGISYRGGLKAYSTCLLGVGVLFMNKRTHDQARICKISTIKHYLVSAGIDDRRYRKQIAPELLTVASY